MEKVVLRNTDLKVSRLCMGGCPMGGYGWGIVRETELIDAVHMALEKGVNFFDTADTYGLGQSERTLAKALGSKRKEVVIATKFGVKAGNGKTVYDNSPKYIVEACEASLKRLNTDYIDLYQVHYRDGITPLHSVIYALEKLKHQGKIRYYGLSNLREEDYDEVFDYIGKIVSFQEEYSLACRKNESKILYLSSEGKMTPMTWGSLGQGILTGKYDKNVHFESNDRRSRDIYVNFHGDKLLKNLEIVEVMKRIATKYNTTLTAVAIRFILDYIPESIAICGAKRTSQILENVEGCGWHMDQADIAVLDEISR